jgi:hypothetical protein
MSNVQQTVVGSNNIFSATGDVYVIHNPLPVAEVKSRRELGILLQKVKTFWIHGFLEKSLYQMVLMDLGKEARPDAIDHPWDSVLELPDQQPQSISTETKLIDLFEQANRSFLILGEPGSGKTTALLELARDLITRCEKDPEFGQAIPVIFNLSSWADRHQPLFQWMIDELAQKYQVPKKLGQDWLEEHRILPLLDGLDEVKAEHRSECVGSINTYCYSYGLSGLVVCSRLKEYTNLPVRLKLNAAINLQELSIVQVQKYLSAAGPTLSGLQAAISNDDSLLSLAQSPLILSVMTLAYRNMSLDELTNNTTSTMEERRRHLFDTYIEKMFKRHGSSQQPYSPEQTKQWLAWLAERMVQNKQSIFLIEALQPIWLTDRNTRRAYLLISRIVLAVSFMIRYWLNGLLVGIGLGLFDILRFEKSDNARIRPVQPETNPSDKFVKVCAKCGFRNDKKAVQCANCLTNLHWAKVNLGKFQGTEEDTRRIGMESRRSRGFPVTEDYMPVQATDIPIQKTEYQESPSFLPYFLLVTVISLFDFFRIHHGFSNIGDLFPVLFSATLLSGFFWSKARQTDLANEIKPAESVHWSLRQSFKVGCVTWVLFFILSSVIFIMKPSSLADITNKNGSLGLVLLCVLVGFLSLTITIPVSLMGGLQVKKVEEKSNPNQGIRLSIKNTLFIAAVFGTITLGVELLLHSIIPSYKVNILVLVALFILWEGGLAVIQHYTLRFILWRKKHIPWDYAAFLDYATDRIFLRRVGGGYIFIHRLMMEHFADLYKRDQSGLF